MNSIKNKRKVPSPEEAVNILDKIENTTGVSQNVVRTIYDTRITSVTDNVTDSLFQKTGAFPHPYSQEMLSRMLIYERVSSVTRELLDLLYSKLDRRSNENKNNQRLGMSKLDQRSNENKNNQRLGISKLDRRSNNSEISSSFINPLRISPLEIYILSYDDFIGEEDGVVAIGDRIGFDIIYHRDSTPTLQFYVLMMDLINELPRMYLFSGYNDNSNNMKPIDEKRQNLERVLNMNYPDFEKWMKVIDIEPDYRSFRSRLSDYPYYLNLVGND